MSNLKLALHQLWKAPAFATLAVIALVLGMNAILILLVPMAVLSLIACANA